MVLARVSAGVCMCRQHSKVIAGGRYTTPSLARMFKSGKCLSQCQHEVRCGQRSWVGQHG